MKNEKVLLSLLAVIVGLLVAGIAFYFYENTKTIPPSETKAISIPTPTPTLKPSIFLSIDKPKDEEVFEKKIISISGKTASDAIVIILTNNDEKILTPANSGDFSTTTSIESGQNLIEITGIAPNGERARKLITVTFNNEEF